MTTGTAPYQLPIPHHDIWDMAVDSDLVCTYYDDFFYELGQWQRDVMIQVAGGIEGKHVLDIGCGGLRFGAFILEDLGSGHYYGIDPYPKFLAFGKKLGERMQCSERMTLIQSKDCAFPEGVQIDFAMSQSVFTHMSEPQILDCLNKLLPVMKKGGHLVFTFITTKLPQVHHDGRLYQEGMPVVCAYLAGTQIFETFAEQHGLTLIDPYNAIPHPTGQRVAILRF